MYQNYVFNKPKAFVNRDLGLQQILTATIMLILILPGLPMVGMLQKCSTLLTLKLQQNSYIQLLKKGIMSIIIINDTNPVRGRPIDTWGGAMLFIRDQNFLDSQLKLI